jgi:NAD(P)-dependent dehydrogenase (short-subunit alcohol dehydrogenase family)
MSEPKAGGPVVLVTGAAGQLGTAIVSALGERGAAMILVDRATDALQRVATDLPDGVASASVALDVTADDAADRALAVALERFGRLDALVNNAGLEGPIGRIEDVAIADLRALFEVNVFALARFSAVAVRHFRGVGGGRIVNMASGAGMGGTGLMAPYSASKHAVVGLTRSLAKEAGDAGISVNAVCPGCVDSAMMERIEAQLGEIAGSGPVSFVDGIPMGRYCDPREVAATVAWLALEAPSYVTGSTLVIDGGLRA